MFRNKTLKLHRSNVAARGQERFNSVNRGFHLMEEEHFNKT